MPVEDPIQEARRQWVAHGWTPAADGMVMVTSMSRVNQLLGERIDASLRPFNLTFARFEILRLLAFTKQGSLPMSKLGSRLQVHAASITSAVGRLVEQGYVERLPSERDKRIVLASITDAGRATIEKATERMNAEVFAHSWLDVGELAALNALLTNLRQTAGDITAPDA